MTFIRYKKFGQQEYAYEVTTYWDKKTKRPVQKSKYLGVVEDKKKKIFKKRSKEKMTAREKYILDFGDSFLLHSFFERNGFRGLIEDSFGDDAKTILTLVSYKLCYPAAMRLAATWQQGNVIKHLHKDAKVSSQRISELLEEIGNEDVWRTFFENYLSFVNHSSDGLALDITALPNQIHIPFSLWGHHDEQITKQIKLMLVVDKANSIPLYFRYMPGSIADVSSLKTTAEEMKKFDIKGTYFILDAGFFSEDNIRSLQKEKIPFLIRLPALRKLYKHLILDKCDDLENLKYGVKYGKRALFVKQLKVELFEKKAFAYIILDPERKGRETKKMLLRMMDEISEENQEMDLQLKRKGIMILVSSFEIPRDEVVSSYYTRQVVEQLFGFSKDDLNILPLRVHKEESLRGYLLLMFISLSAFLFLRKKLGKEITVEEALLSLRNLKGKVFEKEIVIAEPTKEQKEIYEKFDILVPNVLGI